MIISFKEKNMKYSDWLNEWLFLYVQPSSKRRTYYRYKEIVKLHINDYLGAKDLDSITLDMLQKHIIYLLNYGNHRTQKGLSSNTVNGIITLLQSSLKCAYNLGKAKHYIADRIKRPKSTEKEISCFTLHEQKIIEKEILSKENKRLYGVIICLYTGLRIGELLALQWQDIDFKEKTMFIRHTVYELKGEDGKMHRYIDCPKTSFSMRCIPIPIALMNFLLEMKKSCESATYVVSSKGKQVSTRSYQKTFEHFLAKQHIPHRGFHALRHTFTTRALECGIDVKTLSEILGHKNATTTLNRYAHSLLEHKRNMMNKLCKLL